jgi:hypothetical protein
MKIGILILIAVIILVIVFVFRKNNTTESNKPWYSFLANDEKIQFESEVNAYFSKKGSDFKINFEEGIIHRNEHSYGLENIAQIYHQATAEERKNIIPDYFDKLFAGEEEEKKITEHISDFSIMRPFLAVRIYPIDYAAQVGDSNLVFRKDLDSSLTSLVLDLPSSVRTLKPDEIKPWNISVDSLFSIGISNVFEKYKVEVTKQEITKSISVWLISSDDVFASTHVFNLKSFPQCVGKYGALILLPHRHSIVTYPIEDLGVVEATKILIPLAQKMFAEGPGSITPSISWHYEGKFINLPYKISSGKIDFVPPDEFVTMLNKLGEAKK